MWILRVVSDLLVISALRVHHFSPSTRQIKLACNIMQVQSHTLPTGFILHETCLLWNVNMTRLLTQHMFLIIQVIWTHILNLPKIQLPSLLQLLSYYYHHYYHSNNKCLLASLAHYVCSNCAWNNRTSISCKEVFTCCTAQNMFVGEIFVGKKKKALEKHADNKSVLIL